MDEENSAIQCQCVEKGIRAYARHRRFTITKLAVYKDRVKKKKSNNFLSWNPNHNGSPVPQRTQDQPRACKPWRFPAETYLSG
ncbi:hypothetical protein CapIbe_003407 [Capra ibex]